MPDTGVPDWELGLLWLELTNRCQLRCVHCYAQSGPDGRRGTMTSADWRSVIGQAAEIGFHRVTFIGGEPTLNRDLSDLAEYSLQRGLRVSIFSNLTHVPQEVWRTAGKSEVRLQTTYYSSSAAEHDAITGIRGSHALTLAAIREAAARGVTVHVALIEVRASQDAASARREVGDLGAAVSGRYPTRPVGRAASLIPQPATKKLCGRCAFRTLAVDCDGFAYPCVFARDSAVGYVRQETLTEILANQRMRDARLLARDSLAEEVPAWAANSRCAP
jgi:MoaA/NifB/PqqE/SkfB family radical SAM enzyme